MTKDKKKLRKRRELGDKVSDEKDIVCLICGEDCFHKNHEGVVDHYFKPRLLTVKQIEQIKKNYRDEDK